MADNFELVQVGENLRQCRTCLRRLSRSEFYRIKSKSWDFTQCKACYCRLSKESRERRRDKLAEYYQRPEVRERRKTQTRLYARSDQGKTTRRKTRFKKLFGITLEEYDKLLTEQSGVCAICGKTSGKRRLTVDHCHITGRIRGLLCVRCNTALGMAGDQLEFLLKVVRYLQEK